MSESRMMWPLYAVLAGAVLAVLDALLKEPKA
jgi:hypothetical protein